MSEAMIARLEASVEHNEATGNFRCKREPESSTPSSMPARIAVR